MRHYMEDVKNTFFSGSFTSLVSFFAKEENLSDKEISDIIDIINRQKS
jgi:predicted transcriptional regulator